MLDIFLCNDPVKIWRKAKAELLKNQWIGADFRQALLRLWMQFSKLSSQCPNLL
jgi:hypothetical protein